MVKIRLGRIKLYRLGEIMDGFIKIPLTVVGDPSVIKSERILGLDRQRACIVRNGIIIAANFIIGKPAVEK